MVSAKVQKRIAECSFRKGHFKNHDYCSQCLPEHLYYLSDREVDDKWRRGYYWDEQRLQWKRKPKPVRLASEAANAPLRAIEYEIEKMKADAMEEKPEHRLEKFEVTADDRVFSKFCACPYYASGMSRWNPNSCEDCG